MAAAPAEDAAAVRDPDPMSPDHRAIFLGAPAPRFLLRLEPEGRFVYVDVNPAGEAHVGLRRDEMVGRTAADLFEPATAELMESSHRACAVAGRPIVVCDAKLLPSGLRRADARLTPIFGAGGEVAMIEVAIDPGQDRTELGGSLDGSLTLLTSAFEAAGIGLCVSDADGRIVQANQAMARLSGASRAELVGSDLTALFPAEDAAEALRQHGAVAAGAEGRPAERRMRRADGRLIDVLVTAKPLTLDGGARCVVTTFADVSDRRELEERLRIAQQRSEAASRSKSAFLANMSHELRTPLNAIIGFSEMMRQEVVGPLGTPKYREYADDIHFSGTHLLGIVDGVLDLAKIEAGHLRLDEAEVEPAQLLEEVLRLSGEQARAGGVMLATESDPRLAALRCDGRLVRQVLLNLVVNAIKFTAPGGRVTLSAVALADGQAAFAVSDTGSGMPLARIPEALEPFGQVHDAAIAGREGTGLGLPLCKAIVEAHGGWLFINSELGAGTTVFATFGADRVRLAADAAGGRPLFEVFAFEGLSLAEIADRPADATDLDRLPVGAIQVDAEGRVLRYNAMESRFSGYEAEQAVGRNFFRDIAPCTRTPEFHGRFAEGMAAGRLDALFEYVFPFPRRRMKVWINMRLGAEPGTAWIFVRWV